MAGTGAGYDLSVSTFSPDGRVFQVEYACKAVDSSGLCMAAQCRDGVVFLVEKPKPSPLLLPSSMRRIHAITEYIGMAIVGLPADGRQLVKRAREEAAEYLRTFGVDIQPAVLAERIGLYMHAYSLYWSVRPFGAAVLIGAVATPEYQALSSRGGRRSSSSSGPAAAEKVEEEKKSCSAVDARSQEAKQGADGQSHVAEGSEEVDFDGEIYCVDPSGCCSKYRATALGKGRPSAKTELEKLDLATTTTKEALVLLLKICMSVSDEERDRNFSKVQMEAALLSRSTQGRFAMVPAEQLADAIKAARDAIDAQEREEEDDEEEEEDEEEL